jgi:hypothetical protein
MSTEHVILYGFVLENVSSTCQRQTLSWIKLLEKNIVNVHTDTVRATRPFHTPSVVVLTIKSVTAASYIIHYTLTLTCYCTFVRNRVRADGFRCTRNVISKISFCFLQIYFQPLYMSFTRLWYYIYIWLALAVKLDQLVTVK